MTLLYTDPLLRISIINNYSILPVEVFPNSQVPCQSPLFLSFYVFNSILWKYINTHPSLLMEERQMTAISVNKLSSVCFACDRFLVKWQWLTSSIRSDNVPLYL